MTNNRRSPGDGFDYHALARTLVRQWRGDRAQLAVSIALGFASNTVSHWETGRRTCRASVALRMAELARPGTTARVARHCRGNWEAQLKLDAAEGIALFLGATMQHRTAADVAQRMGISRHVVGRWLRADAEPSLPSFLHFLDATLALSWVIPTIAPGLPFDGLLHGADPSKPVQANVALVSLALELSSYQALDQHSTEWVANRCHLQEESVEQALDALSHMGAIEWSGTHWTPHPSPRPIRGHLVRRPDPGGFRRFKADLARVTDDVSPSWENTTVCIATESQCRKVSRILADAHSQILEVVRETPPEGRIVVLRMDLTTLPEVTAESTPAEEAPVRRPAPTSTERAPPPVGRARRTRSAKS